MKLKPLNRSTIWLNRIERAQETIHTHTQSNGMKKKRGARDRAYTDDFKLYHRWCCCCRRRRSCVLCCVPMMLICWYIFLYTFSMRLFRLSSLILFILRLDLIIFLLFFSAVSCFRYFIYLNSFMCLFSVCVFVCVEYFFSFLLFSVCLFLIQTKCWNVDRIPCNFLWTLIILSWIFSERTNKCTIQNTKEKHNAKQSEKKPENWIRKEGIAFVWQCFRVFFSQSTAMYQAAVVGCPILYSHTLPSIRRPNKVTNPFDFQNICTIILISWSADFVFFLSNQMFDWIFRSMKYLF